MATTASGSASRWGPLWGARPEDWALNEDQHGPGYEAALSRVVLEPGQRVLDVGCGAGAFLRLVSERGAVPYGIDASESLIALARTRLPGVDLRVGDMEHLPYDDDTFHLVTGFTSFFFADDMVGALREARRVAKPGAPVVIQVWGAHERCDLEAMKAIARPYFPPRPPDAAPAPDFDEPGTLRSLAERAGLTTEDEFTVSWAYAFPDDETLVRALIAPAGLALATAGREDEIAAEIVAGLAPYRQPDGGYRLENEYRYLIARA